MQDKDQEKRTSFFENEETIILVDSNGDHYAIPAKHMPVNLIKPAFIDSLNKIMNEEKIQINEEVGLQVLGIFKMPRALRREWTTPISQEISIPSEAPTS